METLERIKLQNIEKTNWKKLRFDQIAKNISERVNPQQTKLNTYVGLEHLDPESIHINRYGKKEDVKGEKLRFYKGDVIFGRRRAYQRKAAVAEFEGFCSAHALVLRANPEVIIPELFPFFLHSDLFMHRAMDISVGSLSPTINWGTLKEQEFLLPPKEEQARLAKLLWAIDEVIEKEKKVLERTQNSYDTWIDSLFSVKYENWDYIPLNKIAKINHKSLKANTEPNYEFYYLDIASIIGPKEIGQLKKIKYSEAPSRAKRIVEDNSIILSMVRPYHKSFVFIPKGNNIIASTGTSVINVSETFNPRFIFHQFFSKKFIQHCENRMTGTNYPAITPNDLKNYKIALPKDKLFIEEQTKKLDSFDKAIKDLRLNITNSQTLQKNIINNIF